MSIRVASDDLNPRPTKRLRHNSFDSSQRHNSSELSHEPAPVVLSQCLPSPLRRIPPDTLLLSLPALLIHPPTHRMHLQSLSLARHALRRCLVLPSLEPAKECRAWTGIAEIGMMWLDSGAEGMAMGEVEHALTKALTISQRHPTLRLYTLHLTSLSARLAQRHQNNLKFAISTLRRLLTTLTSTSTPAIPPHVLFGAHLELIHYLALAAEDETATSTSTSTSTSTMGTAVGKCLLAIQALRNAAETLHPTDKPNVVVFLSTLIKLQLLVRHGMWSSVADALSESETTFETVQPQDSTSSSSHPVPGTLRTHLLMLGVLFHTYAGDAQAASARLRSLHELLDTGILEPKIPRPQGADALEGWNEGVIELEFELGMDTPPPHTHDTPRVLHALAFLLSAVAKRDAVGRAPKKGVFARAGLELRELVGPFGGTGNGARLARIKADLMCEVVAINTMRSDFALSESALDTLTAHLRTHALFDVYAARLALLHAQLAHARGDTREARRTYRVAAFVAMGVRGDDEWVACAARAGEVWVRIGELRRAAVGGGGGKEWEWEWEELRREGESVARECEGQGAALRSVGELVRACLASEILGGKQHLRRALDLATQAQDNHLRALILALSASHYLHTARDHALTMLGTCGQLAVGLGAVPKGQASLGGKAGSQASRGEVAEEAGKRGEGRERERVGGNVPLSLWVGERMAELWRLEGDVGRAERQEGVNERMRGVVERWGR